MELAKDTILESLPELQEGYHQQNLTAALRDMLEVCIQSHISSMNRIVILWEVA